MSYLDSAAHGRQLDDSRSLWDAAAATFDDQPDHGLLDTSVRTAWTRLLRSSLPSKQATVLDVGCGTGSLGIVLAELGCIVTGIDFSPAMIARAKAKAQAAGHLIDFRMMDAAYPQFAPMKFDVLVCRHLLWALPAPDQVLQHWVGLLRPGGRLLLVEGYWHTDAGLHARDVVALLPPALVNIVVRNLSDHADLWGSAVTDERYIITADMPG